MADATVRVSGPVLNLDVRSGVGRSRDGEPGRPYNITTARVLVEDTGIADVTIPDNMIVPQRGQLVDLLADVTVYGGRAQLRAVHQLQTA